MKKFYVLAFAAALAGAYVANKLYEVNPLYWLQWKTTPSSVPEQFVQDARAKGWL